MNEILERFEELDPKQKIAAVAVIPVAILALYYFMFLGPRLAEADQMRVQIDEMLQERTKRRALTAQLPEREREVEDLDLRLKVALGRLPDQKEIPTLLSAISSLGRDSGLDILVFRQKSEVYQEFYAEVPVAMQVRGTYHQVATFFDRVGRLDRIVNVSNIGFRDPQVVDSDLYLEANSQVTTFRFLSDKERDRLIKEKKIKGEPRKKK